MKWLANEPNEGDEGMQTRPLDSISIEQRSRNAAQLDLWPETPTRHRLPIFKIALAVVIVAIALCVAFAARADDMKPYPFTVTVGLVCVNPDELKKMLDAIADSTAPPDAICQVLDGSQPVQATATPVERYTKGSIDGMITKYSAPGLPDIYGIVKLEVKPAGLSI